MLSFEILSAQEGLLDKENFGISKLITSLYPDGILGFSLSTKIWGASILATMSSVFDVSFTLGHVALIARSQCHGQG
jgi:hypothetical protein